MLVRSIAANPVLVLVMSMCDSAFGLWPRYAPRGQLVANKRIFQGWYRFAVLECEVYSKVLESIGEKIMASKARNDFDKNAKDIQRLLDLHKDIGGNERGRRYGLEVLNKSAIVLITAFWEAYCEDIAAEALDHLIEHAKSADALPVELKKKIAKKLKDERHELEIWKIADDGWREYLRNHRDELKEQRDRRLNTPKTANIDELFANTVGLEKMSSYWGLAKKMTPKSASEKLDKFVSLRGAIAHRGRHDTSVTRLNVTDYFDFIKWLVGKSGGRVNNHVKKTTGKSLW